MGVVLAASVVLSPTFPRAAFGAGESLADFTSRPLDNIEATTPLVMLTLNNDHQLYFKAYDDFSDIDGDGTLDLSYNHSIEYYGYFDPNKCYSYDTSAVGNSSQTSQTGRFEPAAETTDRYCDSVSGSWSGNFLNWATMYRIDAVRKLLYGGFRSVDSTGETVLERTYIPNDAHSSAKYYNGTDIGRLTPFNITGGLNQQTSGITLCNTTYNSSAVSQNVTSPPLMRVAQGNFSLWAANERWQCRWEDDAGVSGSNGANGNVPATSGLVAEDNSPDQDVVGLGQGDYIVRVQVCASGLEEDNCESYPTGSVDKPVGLLQEFGEDELIDFGLITGSYGKNLSGGVLRKNISTFSNEVNVDTDGTFISTGGIVDTLNRFRIYGYDHSNGLYNNEDNCPFGLSDFPEGDCTNWGNPQTEMFLEAVRYFQGDSSATSAYQSNDSNFISGLSTAPWNPGNLITEDNFCSSLNVISFNASVVSKDGDPLPDLESQATSQTNLIGVEENIAGNQWFIGETATATDQLCTPKTINNLADAEGLCPEAPRVGGSYKIAGLAYEAHTTDMRPGVTEDQFLDTYGITLAPNVPQVTVNVSQGQNVTLLPACRNLFSSPDGSCQLVDFKIVEQTDLTGKFYVNWEDSEAGGDFDQDMWGIITYVVDPNTGQLTVTTDVQALSTPHSMGFGYIVGGTTEDGFHVHSGINGFTYTDPQGGLDCSAGCDDGNSGFGSDFTPATTRVFSLGASSAGLLEEPLFYASKWGGFDERVGNDDMPLATEEWDRKINDTGAEGSDGLPDNYFFVTNPTQLETSLTALFEDIVAKQASSGTAAAIISNSREGVGAVYQAVYRPEVEDSNDNLAEWSGDVHALYIDKFGYLREDNPSSGTQGRLDHYNIDNRVELFFDEDSGTTQVRRYTSASDDDFVESGFTEHPLLELRTVWDATSQLAAFTDAETRVNRSYDSPANNGRYIFTWDDRGSGVGANFANGVVDNNETMPFLTSSFGGDDGDDSNDGDEDAAAENFRLLGVSTVEEAHDIINWVRGDESIPGLRNRTVDLDDDGNVEALRVADIVNSSPLAVGPPRNFFEQTRGDDSYAAFKEQYENRRIVVYSGTNGGLIQANNGGFFDDETDTFALTGDNSETAHPLGSELWAYVPYNLLPHLQWLPDPDYTHVYYIDGQPEAFDVRIFPDDADHPGGWGTILVVGMRLGGGPFEVDHDNDGSTADITLRSAYVVLDITNPEDPPELIAEINHPELGFTTNQVSVVTPDLDGDGEADDWALAFGSGPTDLASYTASSADTAKLYIYDLVNEQFVTPSTSSNPYFDTALSSTFIGSVNGADIGDFIDNGDDDFGDTIPDNGVDELGVSLELSDNITDYLYFGTVNGSATSSGGAIMRFDVDSESFSTVINPGQPFSSAPILSFDESDRIWVFGGSGRYYVNDDKTTTAQQSFYGIREPADASNDLTEATVSKASLVDVSDIAVFTDGTVQVESGGTFSDVGTIAGIDVETFEDLEDAVEESGGWYIDFLVPGGGDPSVRNLTRAGLQGGALAFTSFLPSDDLCEPLGESDLSVVYYKTGTANPDPLIVGGTEIQDGFEVSLSNIDLGPGRASAPVFHSGVGAGVGRVSVVTQSSTATIDVTEVTLPVEPGRRMSWRELVF